MIDAINTIKASLKKCYENDSDFLEHVNKIAAVGVKAYKVNLRNKSITYYFTDDSIHQEELLMPMAFRFGEFDQQKLANALEEVQKKIITYPEFLERITIAGINRYGVFIDEAKVIYYGERGSVTEYFPLSRKHG
ncbi:Phage envelope protein [Legionella lansingensis]|uniref:Phage envelope protein n=1 Tax=Legionella lansingensis TaxID=45067 RepID=A0A0W0VRM4_9GAMM|nr:DUF1398 family protein [Legionella lansingensis]KTD22650.1 hypothetical protein Llan_1140 [Legionella lansingensis]SNV56081.1 Phage envelope protein [Legionella lansingensis]